MLFLVKFIKENKTKYQMFEAQSSGDLLQLLEQDQINPLFIRTVPLVFKRISTLFKPKVSVEQKIEILSNLVLILQSGISLHEGLEDFIHESTNSTVSSLLQHLMQSIQSGMSLSLAMKAYEDVFSKPIIQLVKMGEETGQLEVTLLKAKKFLENQEKMVKQVKTALIYPSIMFVVALFAVSMWFIVVLPQLAGIFQEMEIELPFLTQLLLYLSDIFTQWGVTLFVVALVIGAGLYGGYKQSNKAQTFIMGMLLKIPYISDIICAYNIANITQYLHLSLGSGVSLFSAIENLEKNIPNSYFQSLITRVKGALSKGEQLSSALKEEPLFSAFSVRMIRMGEKSASLDRQLDNITTIQNDKLDYYANNIAKIIEPVFMVLIGVFFVVMMLGMISPLYDVIAKV